MLIEIANGSLLEGDPTGALQTLAEAERDDPSLPELYHSRALAFFGKHDLSSAIKAARHSVSLKSNYSDANNTLGKLLIDDGKLNEAEGPLLVAANDPLYRDSYKAWTSLGVLKFRQNDFSQAEIYLNHAIQDAPAQSCIAYYFRGQVELKNNHIEQAIKDYNQATKKTCARLSEAHLALGLAYQQNRQYDLARKTFLDVEKRFPNTQYAEKAMDHLRYLP